jgi:hypothetical protein
MTRLTRQCSGNIRRRLQRLGTRHRLDSTPHASACLLALTLALTASVMLAGPAAVAAQEARGTITGTIQDSSGGVIPGATVTIVNKDRETTITVITNEVGFFQAPYLIPGIYQVNAELQGFKKAAREVEVRIADRLEVNLTLAAGEAVETVTVTADTPILETTNASLGNVVDSRRIAQLPTPNGDPYALIGLAAGVTYTGNARLDRPFEPTHRRLLHGRDARQPQRPDDRRRAEHRHRRRGPGHRLVCAAGRHRAGVPGPVATFDASTGNTEAA